MCPPTYLPALHGAGSWVSDSEPLDLALAMDQWERLRDLVATHIGPVVELHAKPWTPAMTFTRDLAAVAGSHVVLLMADSIRGPFEAPLAHQFLADLGIDLVAPVRPLRFDGGNVLADSHGRLLVGVTAALPSAEFTTAVRCIEAATQRPAYSVPLAGGHFPHIDMAVCDLNGKAWLVYPGALPGFDLHDPHWNALFLDLPVVLAEPADGGQLACNLIVHDSTAIGPLISTELQNRIEHHGINYHGTDLGELLKAGGGAHCLTLELPA